MLNSTNEALGSNVACDPQPIDLSWIAVREDTVPKVIDDAEDSLNLGGRPTKYDPESHPFIAEAMSRSGAPEYAIARHIGIAPSTMWAWKAEHPEFSRAVALGKAEQIVALKQTALQRALGYDYETEKAFQTGVKMIVIEHALPSEKMLQYLLNNMAPEEFSSEKKVMLSADDAFVRFLNGMNQLALLERMTPRKQITVKAVDVPPE